VTIGNPRTFRSVRMSNGNILGLEILKFAGILAIVISASPLYRVDKEP